MSSVSPLLHSTPAIFSDFFFIIIILVNNVGILPNLVPSKFLDSADLDQVSVLMGPFVRKQTQTKEGATWAPDISVWQPFLLSGHNTGGEL